VVYSSGRAGLRQKRKEKEPEDYARRMPTIVDPTGVAAEAYRSLRTNLFYAVVDNPPKLVVLTSPGAGEGKSTTCANLGVVLAQAGKRTLILDCDFRKPVIHRFFGLRNVHGLTDVLVGERSLQEVWSEPVEGLKVLVVGPRPLNPGEVLGTQRFAEFLADVREQFDYVLIDAAPIGLVSDPAVLATKGDAVLLVLDAQNTRKVAVRQAIRTLKAVRANVIGTVMNNLKGSKGEYYYGYGTYKY
jgi:capsular exopolysaccharide synthesis family protein